MEFEWVSNLANYAFIAIVVLATALALATLHYRWLPISWRLFSVIALVFFAYVITVPSILIPDDDAVRTLAIVRLTCTVALLLVLNLLHQPSRLQRNVHLLVPLQAAFDAPTHIVMPVPNFAAYRRPMLADNSCQG